MRVTAVFIIAFMFVGCEEKVDVTVASHDMGLLVVESVFTNELKNQQVKLSLPYLQSNGDPAPAVGALVIVFEDSTAIPLTEFPVGSGTYYTPERRAVSGKLYTLVIRYDDKIFFAQDHAVPVQPLTPLRVSTNEDEYSLILNQTGEDPYYIEHAIYWENTQACTSGASCDARVVFYDLKTIDVNEIFKPDKAAFTFPQGSVVVRKKYSVSPAYRDFLRSMLSETEWRGGVFDVERSNATTNLSAGAVGFFAVCTVVSDTTVVR